MSAVSKFLDKIVGLDKIGESIGESFLIAVLEKIRKEIQVPELNSKLIAEFVRTEKREDDIDNAVKIFPISLERGVYWFCIRFDF